jgi:hypothetical protein
VPPEVAPLEDRARAAGYEPDEIEHGLLCAVQAWQLRFPWRFLPESIGLAALKLFGRRWAGRYVRRLYTRR